MEECAQDPFIVAKNEVLGRHLISTRLIPQGSLIMACKPLVVAPKLLDDPVCLGCCKYLDPTSWHRCSCCGWPLCSDVCEKSELHSPECHAMKSAGVRMGRDFPDLDLSLSSQQPNDQWCLLAAIAPLRCLLLPEVKRLEVIRLQSNIEHWIQTTVYKRYQRKAASFIRDTLRLHKFSEIEILTMAAILDTNAFEVSCEDRGLKGRAIYSSASMMAHSCLPNARVVLLGDEECYKGFDTFDLGVVARCQIPENSIIFINYCGSVPFGMRGSIQRRIHLRNSKFFICGCVRCEDPTDMGLYLDSIRCIACRAEGETSLLVSTSSFDLEADWKCQKCGFSLSAEQMVLGHRRLRSQVKAMTTANPKAAEHFLEEHLGPRGLLHTSSSHILHVKYFLVTSVYGYLSDYLTTDHLLSKVTMCRDLLSAVEITDPGIGVLKCQLKLELQSATDKMST